MLSERQASLLHMLFDCWCFVFPEPGTPGFRLAVHDRYPSYPLPLAPAYLNIRQIMSHPGVYRHVAGVMAVAWQQEIAGVERLSDIRDASTPLVAILSEITKIPMISPRFIKKSHGIPRAIDGAYCRGDRVALIDDVVSEEAVSKRKALAVLRGEGLEVAFIGVVMDNRFRRGDPVDGVPVHSLLGWHESFQALHEAERISGETRDQCVAYPQLLADELRKHGITG